MKAKVKETGRIIHVMNVMDAYGNSVWEEIQNISNYPVQYNLDELEFIDLPQGVQHISDDNRDTSTTDWNQVRVQASIGAMQVILSRTNCCTYKDIAAQAVGYADALIKELKK